MTTTGAMSPDRPGAGVEVTFRTQHDGRWRDHAVIVEGETGIRQLVQALVDQHAHDIVITHRDNLLPSGYPDHELAVGLREGWGALRYDGDDDGGGTWYSRGACPAEPVDCNEGQFPPFCEIPLPTIEAALGEFLRTTRRPTKVTWQPDSATEHDVL